MSKFKVTISESARAIFYSIDEKTQKRLGKAFEALKKNPFKKRSGADIKKLRGFLKPALYRIRVGELRVIYSIIEKEVRITTIMERSKGYRWLE